MARFSLKWLFIAVACSAVSITALMNPGTAWVAVFFAALQLTIFAAIVGAVANRSRAFCLAFAAVALIYWLTASSMQSPTTLLLDKVNSLLFEPGSGPPNRPSVTRRTPSQSLQLFPPDNYFQFRSIGHSILAMGFGCAAGWAAMSLRREPETLAFPLHH